MGRADESALVALSTLLYSFLELCLCDQALCLSLGSLGLDRNGHSNADLSRLYRVENCYAGNLEADQVVHNGIH